MGYVPTALGGFLNTAATAYVLQGVELPNSQAEAQAVIQQLNDGAILQMVSLLGVVFILWRSFLWTFALKYARDLDLSEAAFAVAIPTAFSVAVLLYQFL